MLLAGLFPHNSIHLLIITADFVEAYDEFNSALSIALFLLSTIYTFFMNIDDDE